MAGPDTGPVIVTGAAGFIGMHVAERLLQRGETVIGVDVFNDYYDPALKRLRADHLASYLAFRMVRADIADAEFVMADRAHDSNTLAGLPQE